eukprot:3379442-Pyramimonas_sp.AAC.1
MQSLGLYQKSKGRSAGGKGQGPRFVCGGPRNREHCSRDEVKNAARQVGATAFNFGKRGDSPDHEIALSSET